MSCVICGSRSAFGKKCLDGALCKDCAQDIPFMIDASSLSAEEAEKYISDTRRLREEFEETSKCSNFHMDETHGIIMMVSPKNERAYFYILDFEEAFLYPGEPKQEHGNVYVTEEFRGTLRNGQSISCVFEKRGKCQTKKIPPDRIQWMPPADFLVMRTMFSQMADNEYKRRVRAEERYADEASKRIDAEGLEKYTARAMFFLGPKYTMEQANEARTRLLKAFPENKGEIERAYRVLGGALRG